MYNFEQCSIIILGSKPNAKLPFVNPLAVLTANAAVELGVKYKEKYNARVISLVGSGNLKENSHLQNALMQNIPDEIVILGEKIHDPRAFIVNELGLFNTKITVLNFYERYRLMADHVGWRAPIIGRKSLKPYHVIEAMYDLLGPKTMNWCNCSTGIGALFYAIKRFPNANQFIIAGIGLHAGDHYYGHGKFTDIAANRDKRVMKYWNVNKRPQLYTTDDAMHKYGKVPLWKQNSLD